MTRLKMHRWSADVALTATVEAYGLTEERAVEDARFRALGLDVLRVTSVTNLKDLGPCPGEWEGYSVDADSYFEAEARDKRRDAVCADLDSLCREQLNELAWLLDVDELRFALQRHAQGLPNDDIEGFEALVRDAARQSYDVDVVAALVVRVHAHFEEEARETAERVAFESLCALEDAGGPVRAVATGVDPDQADAVRTVGGEG